MAQRKQYLLRVDPDVWESIERWAADDLRSVNAQVEFILKRALRDAGRLPKDDARQSKTAEPRSEADIEDHRYESGDKTS